MSEATEHTNESLGINEKDSLHMQIQQALSQFGSVVDSSTNGFLEELRGFDAELSARVYPDRMRAIETRVNEILNQLGTFEK